MNVGRPEERQQFAGAMREGLPIFDSTLRSVRGEAIDNWKQGGLVSARQAEGTTMALSAAEQAALDAQARAQAIRSKREREAREEAGAQMAMQLLAGAQPADAMHPYLVAKGVEPHSLRVGTRGQVIMVEALKEGTAWRVGIAGRLLVPLRDISGRIRNVQAIAASGSKLCLGSGQRTGIFHMLGVLRPGAPVIVAGGYAAAATIHRATRMAVAVAPHTDNLMAVATALHRQVPSRPIYLAANNDHHLPLRTTPLPNMGKERAEAAATEVGGKVLLPEPVAGRTAADKGTDWNDYEACHGLAATWPALQAAGLETGEA